MNAFANRIRSCSAFESFEEGGSGGFERITVVLPRIQAETIMDNGTPVPVRCEGCHRLVNDADRIQAVDAGNGVDVSLCDGCRGQRRAAAPGAPSEKEDLACEGCRRPFPPSALFRARWCEGCLQRKDRERAEIERGPAVPLRLPDPERPSSDFGYCRACRLWFPAAVIVSSFSPEEDGLAVCAWCHPSPHAQGKEWDKQTSLSLFRNVCARPKCGFWTRSRVPGGIEWDTARGPTWRRCPHRGGNDIESLRAIEVDPGGPSFGKSDERRRQGGTFAFSYQLPLFTLAQLIDSVHLVDCGPRRVVSISLGVGGAPIPLRLEGGAEETAGGATLRRVLFRSGEPLRLLPMLAMYSLLSLEIVCVASPGSEAAVAAPRVLCVCAHSDELRRIRDDGHEMKIRVGDVVYANDTATPAALAATMTTLAK